MSKALLVTQSQAAEMLGVSLRTVRRMLDNGDLTAVRIHPGARPRVRVSDIETLINPAGNDAETER